MLKNKPRINSRAYQSLLRVFNNSSHLTGLGNLLNELPSIDPILRKAGKNADIYEEISRDAHVIGELRSLRSGLLSFETELVQGDDDATSTKSHELITRFFKAEPGKFTRWEDIDWHSYSAILHGFSVLHLGAYEKRDGYWQPSHVTPWQAKHFAFTQQHELRVKTAENPQGEMTENTRFACVRHMPSAGNPYGVALLSSCFWPWTFKHGGFKFFVQLCERFGIPFPVGKYPTGAQDKDIEHLLDGLAKLVEDGIAAIPDDTSVEILESKAGGEPLPERLVNLCNSEMSKALTSQTLATEQKNGGARAASETHAARAGENQRADRKLVLDARNQIIKQLHEINFDGGVPPQFIFKDKRDINTDTVNRVRESAKLVPVSLNWAYKELGIAKPAEDEELVNPPRDAVNTSEKHQEAQQKNATDFAKADTGDLDGEPMFDSANEELVNKLFLLTQNAKDLNELKTALANEFDQLTEQDLAQVTAAALEYELNRGMYELNQEQE